MNAPDNTAIFLEEAYEILEKLERLLLDLEANPNNSELINDVFRALHTIKGSGAMFGFAKLAEFTHHVENLFDEIRKGRLTVTPAVVNIGLAARDGILRLLKTPQWDADHHALIVSLSEQSQQGSTARVWDFHFVPFAGELIRGLRFDNLLDEFRELGTAVITADLSRVPDLESIDPTAVYTQWSGRLETLVPKAQIDEVFLFADDQSVVTLEPKKIQASPPAPAAAPLVQDSAPAVSAHGQGETSTIRVQRDRLDGLVDVVGELVILQAILRVESERSQNSSFVELSEGLGRLIGTLRDTTMSLRMVPLEELFSSFQRLVRDLSRQLNKPIELVIKGASTELDKNIVESLKDPLIHIIRNSVDHGIEDSAARASRGKPPKATITLNAEQMGSRVEISVADDGQGLNLDRIRERAVERGLLTAGETDVQKIQMMIFEPGFSTAAVTTDLSGRGVGMDVVRKNIEKLRGEVRLDSKPGQGTRVTLSIPLTLVIVEGLLVQVNKVDYVVPLANVQECVDMTQDVLAKGSNGQLLMLRGATIPIVSLRKSLGIAAPFTGLSRLVVVEVDGATVGLLADAVIGRQQVVIKPLSASLRHIRIVSGATILGDGSVALILDPLELVKARMEERNGNTI